MILTERLSCQRVVIRSKNDNYSFKWSNLSNYSYKPKNELAQSHFQTYNAKVFNLGIKMTYKYTVTNMGKNVWNKSINKRDLIKVE